MGANSGVAATIKRWQRFLPARGSAAVWLLAVGLTTIALYVRLIMAPVEAGLQYLTFFPAVALTAVIGGFWPGLLTTLLGVLCATFIFTPPYYSLSIANLQASLWANLVFLIDGLIVCSCIEAMHRFHVESSQESAEARRIAAELAAINQQLRDSEAFGRSLFDSRTEQVAVLDQDGIIIAVNEGWQRFAAENDGLDSVVAVVGLSYLDVCRRHAGDSEDSPALRAAAGIRSVLAGAVGEFSLEYPCPAPNQERWFKLRVTPLHGSRRGVVVAQENISQRKLLEKSLMHHAAIVESSEDAIIGVTLEGMITSWNLGAEHLFGYAGNEVLGRHVALIIPVPYLNEGGRMLDDIRAGQVVKSLPTVRRHKDGRLLDISITVSPLRDASGKVIGASKVARDISAEKRTEQELRIAATAFEAHEGMMITDANKTILRVNRAFAANTGYSAEEAVGQHVRLLNSGRHDAAFYAEMWRGIERDGSWQGEVWNRRKNGEVYPEWLTIAAVKNVAGATTHYVGTHTDITARKLAEDEINNLAFYDPLTRLPNRRLLLDRLQQAQVAAARNGQFGALMFIDLDNFKTLNDTLGHDQGDVLLQEAAHRLTFCVREGDTVARLGGDEFVVILESLSRLQNESADRAEQIGEKILTTLNQPYHFDAHEHHCSASIGLTMFGEHDDSSAELMKQADLAMYQAKGAGRNALRFFDPEMQATVNAHARLEKELRNAVREQCFVLHFQPQVDARGRATGAEALVRWQHPQRGLVAPDAFIPLAEKSGLILPLGAQVLDMACRQLAAWAESAETAQLTLAVNVSGQQLRQADFVDQVLAALARSGADPHRLKLELTESQLLTEIDDTIVKMTALRQRGIRFALDDFGTGYSSLAYLKRLPLETLKIDRTFVMDVLTDANDAAIARTVVALARSLGLDVLAEGVENEGQRRFLADNGCFRYQGYLFSRPLPAAAFAAYLQRAGEPQAGDGVSGTAPA
jgi:diguanylate cyclase (GGDEF)-like protein/PAS domain S-box-containing protein